MARQSGPNGRLWRAAFVSLILLGTAVVVPALAAAAQPGVPQQLGGLPSNPTPFLSATGLFSTSSGTANEHNIVSANSLGAAVRASWQDTFYLNYSWTQGPHPVAVSQAVLDIIYFGATIASRTEVEETPITSSGTIILTASFSQYQYLFGGAYAMTASLVASNGTTAWAQSFYIVIGQPFDPTVVTIALLILGAYEIYCIVTAGKGERPPRPQPTLAQPAPVPSGQPTSAVPGGPSETPGGPGQPYPSESPPPAGGS